MQEVHLMLMENTLRLKNPEQLKYIFDLKGSLVDRKTMGLTTNSTTLKDINFLMTKKANRDFPCFATNTKQKLISVMQKDVQFLRNHNLMDYSLLLGVETTELDGSIVD